MPKTSEAIRNFLSARKTSANADLIERVLAQWPSMECQVNVAAGSGEPVEGKRSTYTDGVNEWFNIRLPKNADTEPKWADYELTYPLDLHAEGIGFTGWNWSERKSCWVGFDIDSLTSHAKGVGINKEELERVKAKAEALPYVEVRKSTGGSGIHLYVYLDDVPSENHTVHAALARCILGRMSDDCGFDFASQIDCCGSVMWVWHRKMSAENGGLEVIKTSTQVLTTKDLPSNWRDHMDVVSRRRKRLKISGLQDEHTDPFESLTGSQRRVELDQSHKDVIEELTRSGFSTAWIPDYHLLQTHTKALESLLEKPDLKIQGVYKTISNGNHPETCNCFAFPLDNGVWRVYRFNPGTPEAETWDQDGNGWTNCYFNRHADLDIAAKIAGGLEVPDGGGYVFYTTEDAARAIEILGQTLPVPDELKGRETTLKVQKDGRVSIDIKKEKDEPVPKGWVNGKGRFRQVLRVRAEIKAQIADDSYAEYDKLVRKTVTPDNKSAGWVVKTTDDKWSECPKDDVKNALSSYGQDETEIKTTLGLSIRNPWKLIAVPFAEYPGGRQWNRHAAQYKYAPVEGEHPHWDMILRHNFRDLDPYVKGHPWCQANGITSGYQYGLLWSASVFQFPQDHLPYLFFWGGENCGKSTFHESFRLLMEGGYASAGIALKSKADFNGELAGAVLAYIEEVDISKTPGALNKIREYVTSPFIWVRQMRTDAYAMPNILHLVQTANSPHNCPIIPGDTRITMIHVSSLESEIPRDTLDEFLKEEAPHYLHTLLNIELPEPGGRLRVPVIETGSKADAQVQNSSAVEQFIKDKCYRVPRAKVRFSELYDNFMEWLTPDEKPNWNKRRFTQELPAMYPRGAHTDNVVWVGNLSWEPAESKDEPWVVVEGRLK